MNRLEHLLIENYIKIMINGLQARHEAWKGGVSMQGHGKPDKGLKADDPERKRSRGRFESSELSGRVEGV